MFRVVINVTHVSLDWLQNASRPTVSTDRLVPWQQGGAADVSFARDFMYGLAHLVAWLRTSFRGRVIWRLNPSTFYQALDEDRKQFFQDSKIRSARRLCASTQTQALCLFQGRWQSL